MENDEERTQEKLQVGGRLHATTSTTSWIQYERMSGAQATRHQGFRRTFHRLLQLPLEAQPTSIFGRQTLRMRGSAAILPKPAEDSTQWWYEILEAPTNHAGILQGIHDETALWVADGAYKRPYGTAAFTLLPTLDATTGITLVNQTPGRHTDNDAYRAEAAGIYGCLVFANALLAQHQITNGSITMACDCKSALLNILE
jgi:hypothetical protein